MKKVVLGILALFCLSLFPSDALCADEYPSEPLRIVVGYSAGGGSDRTTRTLQKFLRDEFGQDVEVENLPGGGGLVAQTALLREKPEGYMTTNVNYPAFAYTLLMQKVPIKFTDLIPMWIEVCDPIILAVRKDSPWKNLGDFIEAVKKDPGKYSVGLATLGGQHANALWLKKQLNLDFKIVGYNSGSDTATALLGGHIDAIFGDAVSRADMREDFYCLGVVADSVNPIWPEGKTFNEQLKAYGIQLPNPNFQARYGVYWIQAAFKEKHPEEYKKLVSAFERATKNPEYLDLAEKSGITPSLVNQEGTGLNGGVNYQQIFNDEYSVIEKEIMPLFKNTAK